MTPLSLLMGLSMLVGTGDGPPADSAAAEQLPEARSSTVSLGHPYTGTLRDGLRLPPTGPHHRVQYSTNRRKWLYGTGYLVRGLLVAARDIDRMIPGGPPLVIGNLSRKGGGDIKLSMSHNTGRDVDIAYYMAARDGRSVESRYHHFGKDGRSTDAPGRYRLDIPRNWAFVKAIMTSPEFEIQWIITAPYIERMLLEYATKIGESRELVFRAERLMMLPGWAKIHDNHFHIRVLCSPSDWARGCDNGGPVWSWSRKMSGALDEARDRLGEALRSDESARQRAALQAISRKRISTAVPQVSGLLSDADATIRRAAMKTLLSIADEANAPALLKVARWTESAIGLQLLIKGLPLAGSEGLGTASALLDGRHPILEARLKKRERRRLLYAARKVLASHRHVKALLPSGP